jgi:hypothetical protein
MPASLSLRALVILTGAFIVAVLVFAGVYTETQHNPVPHQLRVGVVGPQDAVLKVKAGLALSAPGYFKVYTYSNEAGLKSAIKDRKVYGGYIQKTKKSGLLVTAGAAGEAPQLALELVGQKLAAAVPEKLTVEDVAPLPTGDSHGLSSYTYQYGVLVPSFVFGVLIFMFAHGLSLASRLGVSAVYSLGAGIVGALTVDQIIGALPHHFVALAALGALYAATAVLVTYGLARVLGYAGLALSGLLLILVGNSTGGGSINQEFLPDFFRSIGQALPNGAFIRSVRNTEYFNGANTHRAILVVALWAVGGLALVLLKEKFPGMLTRSKKELEPKPSA